MEKMKINERGSNHMKSQLERFMRRKGRQFCAAALCVLMLVSNVATSIGSTGEDSNEVAEFTVDRDSLCVELVKAVERGKTVKNTLEFDGEEADTYAELFDADGTLYKLKPEIKDNASKLSLTVYARLGEELEKEDRQNYEIDGSEEIIFLLKNEADREQTAVIRVGDKCSEEITVAAKSAVGVTEEETVEEPAAGPAGENATPGGGSAAGGAAAAETVSDGTLPAEESTAASDIEESKEETSAPAEGAGEQETDAPEQESGSEIEAPKEDGENATETGEGQEEAADQDEEKNENESGVTEDNGTGTESGTTEGGNPSEKADDGQTAGDDSKSEQDADNSGASEGGSSDNADNSDNSSSDSSDSGDNGSDDSVTASISVHKVARVMTTVEAANGATPQEAEKEETVVEVLHEEEDEATEEEDEATPSEATPSELWELFDGECFDAVCLGDGAAVAFVTTAEELGLDDEIYEAELDNVIVRVTADRGILPEGADLSVTELSEENEETAEQYKEAKKALDEDGTEYDGMMALDISFYDAEGNELEPEDGTVRVFIEMKPEALPENIAPDTLVVQHLKETADGNIIIEKVADTTDETEGIIKQKEVVEEESVNLVAEFEVESFSSFTITWKDDEEKLGTVAIKYVDTDGNELFPDTSSLKLDKDDNLDVNKDTIIELQSYDVGIAGYAYKEARIGGITGSIAKKVRIEKKRTWYYPFYRYQLQYAGSGNEWKDLQSGTIVLIYQKTGSEPEVPDISKTITYNKYVETNANGTYNLNLTVSGAIGSITNKAKIDIVFVLDKSTSMNRGMNSDDEQSDWKDQRMRYATDAIKTMVDSIETSGRFNSRFSLVTFGTKATDGKWVSSAADLKGLLPTLVASRQGTNYEDGLLKANTLLESADEEAVTVVVFVSDGDPSYYNSGWNNSNSSVSGKGTGYDAEAMAQAQYVVATMNANYFFTVGVGPEKNYTKLSYLTHPQNNGSPVKGKDVNIPEGMEVNDFSGTSENDLKTAFKKMEGQITNLLCSDVLISDKLSENVKMVEPINLLVSVKNSEGETIYGPKNPLQITATEKNKAVSLIASYNDTEKTITLDFPDGYVLEPDWTYVVTANIDVTEQAYDNYRDNNNTYPNMGDLGTGDDSSGKEGLYSNNNDKATVQYTFNGESPTLKYQRPVVQLKPGELIIEKQIVGLDMDQEGLDKLINGDSENPSGLCINVTLEWPSDKAASGKEQKQISIPLKEAGMDEKVATGTNLRYSVSKDTTTEKYTIRIKGLSPDTKYEVTESAASVTGYQLETQYKDASGNMVIYKDSSDPKAVPSGTVEKGMTGSVEITNNYTKVHTITVKKSVTGNMAEKNPETQYKFTYKIFKSEEGKEDIIHSTGELHIKDNNSAIIENIPEGYQVTITEDKDSASGYKVSYMIDPATTATVATDNSYTFASIEKDETITFINDKSVNIPTGIFTTNLPHLLMLAFAFFSTVVLLLFSYKRKVRRAE